MGMNDAAFREVVICGCMFHLGMLAEGQGLWQGGNGNLEGEGKWGWGVNTRPFSPIITPNPEPREAHPCQTSA